MAHWTELEVFDAKKAGITELQSIRCSNCGRYLTTPFMYYIDEPKYCPQCGAKMKEGE